MISKVPKFDSFFEPVLHALSKGEVLRQAEIESRVVKYMGLPLHLYNEVTPKTKRPRITDRISWSLTYLSQSGLLDKPMRAHYKISEKGLLFLRNAPRPILVSSLEEIPEFQKFLKRAKRQHGVKTVTSTIAHDDGERTPEERILEAYETYQQALIAEVESRLSTVTPVQFERLVLRLLHQMGYGIPDDLTSVQHTGRSGDGGIDGIIYLDKLRLEKICLQAKKYHEQKIPRKEVQAFVGALTDQGTTKGVFLTTSSFSAEAQEYVKRNKLQISLIDGRALSELMVEYNTGVSVDQSIVLKRIDNDFFDGLESP